MGTTPRRLLGVLVVGAVGAIAAAGIYTERRRVPDQP
jgi:hypothetical protein